LKFIGFFGKDVIGKQANFYFEGDEKVYAKVDPIFKGLKDIIYVESWQRRKDKKKRLLAWWCKVLKNEAGEVSGALSTGRDITKKKKNEKALRESEERFRNLIENAFDGIYITNGKHFIYVNDRFCKITGYSEKELTAPDFNFNVTLTSESKKIIQDRVEMRKIGKELPGTYEFQIELKDGTYKYVETSTVNLTVDGQVNVMGIVRDVSERKKIASLMIQSERLSALGEMSAGIAHEINQPLNTLSLIMDNILFEAQSTKSIGLEYLNSKTEKIFESILRIRNIIDHIRSFSRNQDEYIQSDFNINESITNALSMISEQYKILGIEMVANLDKEIPTIHGNTYKLEQVILNLLSNAKDALIEKKNKLQEYYTMSLLLRTFTQNGFIIIEIEDNGIGVKKEDFEKLLIPFFTTKEVGKGTGLGLSITHELIQEMKGDINIISKHLKGTTISISLPISTEKTPNQIITTAN